MPKKTIVRDAITGLFVKSSEAQRRPKTTVKETINVPAPKKKGKWTLADEEQNVPTVH